MNSSSVGAWPRRRPSPMPCRAAGRNAAAWAQTQRHPLQIEGAPLHRVRATLMQRSARLRAGRRAAPSTSEHAPASALRQPADASSDARVRSTRVCRWRSSHQDVCIDGNLKYTISLYSCTHSAAATHQGARRGRAQACEGLQPHRQRLPQRRRRLCRRVESQRQQPRQHLQGASPCT